MTKRGKQAAGKARAGPPRFDVAALRDLAGAKVFARGVDYHAGGQVEIVSIAAARVVARVIGSELYRCELHGTGREFSGGCDCPAFSDWGFCKHLVATALTVNNLDPEALKQAGGRLTKIRDHLRGKGIEPLIEIIMGVAERDPAFLADLELAATAATADEATLFAQYKKAITDATRTRGFVEYRDARQWAAKIEQVLRRVESLIGAGRAELVLRLLDHFFARMDDALGNMDDSDGDGGAVYAKGCEIHLQACRAAKPEPVALARQLFAREVDSDWDFFHGASDGYADVLGDRGLAEYRRLANEAWSEIKPLRANGRSGQDDQFSARYRLKSILESIAARDGDVDARIAIRKIDLSTAYAYLGIAQLCLDHGREAEAVKWAEDGLWQFDDRPDQRLVGFTADLYRKIGRARDADDLLWKVFERDPGIDLYKKLKGGTRGEKSASPPVADRAIALLRSKLEKSDPKLQWSSPRELLVEVLVLEKRFAEAWNIARTHGCSGSRLDDLAKASEQSHPQEALAAYERKADRLAGLGGAENYKQVRKLIAQMQSIRQPSAPTSIMPPSSRTSCCVTRRSEI